MLSSAQLSKAEPRLVNSHVGFVKPKPRAGVSWVLWVIYLLVCRNCLWGEQESALRWSCACHIPADVLLLALVCNPSLMGLLSQLTTFTPWLGLPALTVLAVPPCGKNSSPLLCNWYLLAVAHIEKKIIK